MVRDVAILGATGRIGTALCNHANRDGKTCLPVEKDIYKTWASENEVIKILRAEGLGKGDVLICAAGILDPKANEAEIQHVNYNIPSVACAAARELGAKAVSLGTVLEIIMPNQAQNPYVSSKRKLQEKAHGSWIHLQLHTIFGGKAPTPFMFTGLMLQSLKYNTRFSMTPGLQLREYHHVDDEAAAIFTLISELDDGCLDVSHGDSIKLCDLATVVFENFGKTDLLGIGDMESPSIEAYDPVFTKHKKLKDCSFRSTLPAVAEWLESYV